jgi:hypothetical protein
VGGTTGQVLSKIDAADYHTQWTTLSSISDTAPASPQVGQLWFDSVGAKMYIWFNDGTSSQWLPT